METRDIIELTASITGSIILLAGVVAGIFYGFRRGTRNEKNEIINSADEISKFWKDQAEGYKAMNEALLKKLDDQKTDYTNQIHILSKEMSEIKGKFDQAEKQKAEYLSILQNRDPALTEYIKFSTEATKGFQQSVMNFQEAFKRIHERLDAVDSKFNKLLSDGRIQ